MSCLRAAWSSVIYDDPVRLLSSRRLYETYSYTSQNLRQHLATRRLTDGLYNFRNVFLDDWL